MKLTRDEILNMPAGRGLDALIAQEVMGRVRKEYSTDIAAAWEVVEKFKENWVVEVGVNGGFYWCDMDNYKGVLGFHSARADSAPLAICRAALLAVTDTYR